MILKNKKQKEYQEEEDRDPVRVVEDSIFRRDKWRGRRSRGML